MVLGLLNNIAWLLSLSILATLFSAWQIKYKKTYKAVVGILTGLCAIAIMSNPLQYDTGIIFDTRTILLSVTGMFFGAVPSIIAACIAILFRVSQGFINGFGGVWMGVATILLSSGLGVAWHYWRLKKQGHKRRYVWLEMYIFGLVVHAGMVLCMFLLPDPYTAMSKLTLPVMIAFPIVTVLLGFLMLYQQRRRQTEYELKESEERYRNLFENNLAVMNLVDPQTLDIVDVNPACCAYYGWSREDMKKMKISDITLTPPEQVHAELDDGFEEGRSAIHRKHRLASGEVRDVEVYFGPIQVQGKKLFYTIIHDITERATAERNLKASEERFKVTLLSVGDGVIATDRNGRITIINKMAEELTGWTFAEIQGSEIDEIIQVRNEKTGNACENPIQRALERGEIVSLANHTVLTRKDGTSLPIADSAAPIHDENGRIQGAVLVIRDVTEERKKREEIIYLGYHDSMTGLYNRRFFEEELKRLDTKRNLPFSIIIGDVNGLKLTNDAFGHATGDRLLKRMGETIKKACREDDIVARWGGDEFIMLLPRTKAQEAEEILKRIKYLTSRVKMESIDFSISLGYATKTGPDEEIAGVIKKAEDYMYRRKSVESQSMRGNTIETILSTLHEKSQREKLHSERVSKLCRSIGTALGLSQNEVDDLGLIGLMHDIGKIAISEEILNKTHRLTGEEWAEVKRHAEIGFRILSSANTTAYIAGYVLAHHERMDGTGYPNRLSKDDIPFVSRVLSVADSYDAMTTDRPYKRALTDEMAAQELIKHAGTQFDPEIVKVFIEKVLNNKKEAKQLQEMKALT